MYICTYMHIYMHININMYKYAYICTYLYECRPMRLVEKVQKIQKNCEVEYIEV